MIVRQFTCRAVLFAHLRKPGGRQAMARPSSGKIDYLQSTNLLATTVVAFHCLAVFMCRSGSIQGDFLQSQEYRHHHWSRGECGERSSYLQRSGRLLEKMGSTGMHLQLLVQYNQLSCFVLSF